MKTEPEQNQNKYPYGRQSTLVRGTAVAGFGFWSGRDVTLEFLPAPENYGIRFQNAGSGEEPVPAFLSYRTDKPRQTSLKRGAVRFDMVEHVMAALAGMRVDNCLIRINGEEMPGMDGSALPFVRAIREAGLAEQDAPKRVRVLRKPVQVIDGAGLVEAVPSPAGEISYAYEMDYSGGEAAERLGKESFEIQFPGRADETAFEHFLNEIAPARTFLTDTEAEYLLKQGLCSRVSPRDVLVFGKEGPIDNTLRFSNECARHKTLDMMGDLALGGALIVAKFRAVRTGHLQNAALLAKIIEQTDVE